ncbi:uracil-DNA glycosylase family protein [Streptomyces sp. H10-C2]|uniref:uracil-DNA glycosylase family protein n=1 Tax=unclassified Streptomyces TaxID=2593676 RepID=UPI0024B8F384|nr:MULTISPECIES: uracil-DNA glycosylase family protein [unclassified Streptomyces]MDJ0346201.1 uracil-DNA glycosylase family protein [Streptomyces sp. PH10-H1]MDJ0371152.1 uracil-DNA glycosylase family protein [Streptomyces sp. H10-C2]
MHDFDPGYAHEPYATLAHTYPGPETYPAKEFRVEWGPIFHRGRLDGTARVLVIGQDPAAHEAITRRILVGTAGRRFQGFLGKLGIDSSYVMVNTYLYSVYGQNAGNAHATDPAIAAYRHSWLDAVTAHNPIQAVIALGGLADTAVSTWRTTPSGATYTGAYQHILHPTYPDSAASSGTDPAQAMAKLLTNWNAALDALHGTVTPDTDRPLTHYGSTLAAADLGTIPEGDLPPGLPAWMRSDEAWAARQGTTPAEKRATILVQIPADQRPF